MTDAYHPKFLQAAAELKRLNANPVEDELHHLWHLRILEDLYKYASEDGKAVCQDWLRQAKWRRAWVEKERLEEREGADALLKQEHEPLFLELLMNAPAEIMPRLVETSRGLRLLPDAAHLNAQGQPVYDPKQLAKNFGVSIPEISAFLCAAGFGLLEDEAQDPARTQ